MSNVYVDNELVFKAGADIEANVKGNMLPQKMVSIDWFDQTAIDLTNNYTSTLGGTSDACALEAAGQHGVKLTTGTGDNEVSFLSTGLIFDISQSPIIEARVKIVDVSGTFFYFGFSDATSETTPSATIDADSGTLAAVATDAAGFVVDADLGTSSIYCASANTGAAVQSADTAIDWTDNQTKNLRVALDSSGNARLYIDGVEKAYIALAVADVPLCATFNYGTRANDGANIVNVRYLAKFQDIV